MNFPKFWAKATQESLTCWRWSDESMEEAQTSAQAAVESLAARFKAGENLRQGYGYAIDRPVREQVLRQCLNDDGVITAVVTRNVYGCLVLNTAHILFVDVDLPETKAGTTGGVGKWFKGIFGGAKPVPAVAPANVAQTELLAKAKKVVERQPEWGWRIYRTRAGFRLLATHAFFNPATGEAESVFEELGADPLYRQLCKVQKCFRARLTPKPWRSGVNAPSSRWPWVTSKHEKAFKEWEDGYVKACEIFATCELIAVQGNQEIHPEIQPIVAIHDEAARVGSNLPLA